MTDDTVMISEDSRHIAIIVILGLVAIVGLVAISPTLMSLVDDGTPDNNSATITVVVANTSEEARECKIVIDGAESRSVKVDGSSTVSKSCTVEWSPESDFHNTLLSIETADGDTVTKIVPVEKNKSKRVLISI